MRKREQRQKINLDGQDLGTLHLTGGPMLGREEWLELYENIVDAAVADARSGRFHKLADELYACGDPHIDSKPRRVHPKIIAWVMEGCPVTRRRGHPGRDHELEDKVYFYYDRARSEYDTNHLPEKQLLLWIVERFPNHRLSFEGVRNIIRKKAQEDADKHYPNAASKRHAMTLLKRHLKEYRLDEQMHRQRFAAIIAAQVKKKGKGK